MKQKVRISLFIAAAIIPMFSFNNAKSQLFHVGDKDLNFTIGYGSPWVIFRDEYTTMLPPVAVSFDYGFRDDLGPGVISIGGIVAATTYKDEAVNLNWRYDYGWKSTTLIGAVRGTYHYQLVDALDTYGGVHVGMRYESWREYGTLPTNTPVLDATLRPILNLFAGAKFYFSDNLCVMSEIGFGIAFINIGLGLKM